MPSSDHSSERHLIYLICSWFYFYPEPVVVVYFSRIKFSNERNNCVCVKFRLYNVLDRHTQWYSGILWWRVSNPGSHIQISCSVPLSLFPAWQSFSVHIQRISMHTKEKEPCHLHIMSLGDLELGRRWWCRKSLCVGREGNCASHTLGWPRQLSGAIYIVAARELCKWYRSKSCKVPDKW